MAAELSTNSSNRHGGHYKEGRTCALAGVAATHGFRILLIDVSTALNAALTLYLKYSLISFRFVVFRENMCRILNIECRIENCIVFKYMFLKFITIYNFLILSR